MPLARCDVPQGPRGREDHQQGRDARRGRQRGRQARGAGRRHGPVGSRNVPDGFPAHLGRSRFAQRQSGDCRRPPRSRRRRAPRVQRHPPALRSAAVPELPIVAPSVRARWATAATASLHWMRNALAHAPAKQRTAVAAMPKAIFAQEAKAEAEAQWIAVADALREKRPKLGEMMDGIREDVLACMGLRPFLPRTVPRTVRRLRRTGANSPGSIGARSRRPTRWKG